MFQINKYFSHFFESARKDNTESRTANANGVSRSRLKNVTENLTYCMCLDKKPKKQTTS